MRRSREEAAQTREGIVQAAADLVRQNGLGDASIANVMAAAGLTHGGFYKHFRNRDQLLAEAVALAGATSLDEMRRNLANGGKARAVSSYLSKAQRDAKTPICPLAAAGSELGRASVETRRAATQTVATLLDELALAADDSEMRERAVMELAAMVGGLILSRIVTDPALSDEILTATRASLVAA